jgi:hypothetical protein
MGTTFSGRGVGAGSCQQDVDCVLEFWDISHPGLPQLEP